jgi:hypothetical protein
MLDQNTTTIIASIIAVLGTLGGAITGVILSNRHTAKMERLRIEQEKLKRNTEIIEEAYSQLMLFIELSSQAASDAMSLDISADDFLEKSKEVYLRFNRLYVLIKLYHPSLKHDLGDVYNTFQEYWMNVSRLYDAKKQRQKTDVIDELLNEVNEGRSKHDRAQLKLQESLEALVK